MPDPMQNPNDRRRYANALRLASEKRIEDITRQLADGTLTLQDWQLGMKDELRRSTLEQYVTGKGGDPANINQTDYLALGPELKSQYKYLNKFAAAIDKASKDGKPLDFAMQRAKLYARSTQAVFWKSEIPVQLPQYPRDGSTACKSNCKCRLRVQHLEDAVLVWWQLSPAEHCEDCLALARKWNPLRLELKGEDVQESDIAQGIELMLLESPELRPVARELYAIFDIAYEDWQVEDFYAS